MKTKHKTKQIDTSTGRFTITDYFFVIGITGLTLGILLAIETILSIRASQFPEYYLRPGRGSAISLLRAIGSTAFFRYALSLFTIGFISMVIALARRHQTKRKAQN